MFGKSLLVVIGLVLCGVAQNGWAIIENDAAQNDPTWQQAYINLGDEYPSVVGLYGFNGTSWGNVGSGVVISPYNVITASHCVLGNAGGTKFQEYGIETGNDLNSPWGMYTTTTASVIPQFTGIESSPDMGILTFSQSIDVTPAPLYTGSDLALVGSPLVLSGFGYYGFPSTGDVALDGLKRGCQDTMIELGDSVFGAASDQLVMEFDYPGGSNYHYLGGCIAPGDSGGGVFTASGQLAGVNDWNYGGSYYGYSGATSVSQHLDYIDSQIVPEPGTLILLGTAVASFLFYRMKRRG